MELPVLYRRRYLPDEIVKLKDDKIIHYTDDIIVTKWSVLKPRKDFSSGISWYFLEKGFKVSKFFRESGELHYIYCDIIEHIYNRAENSYTFNDLLVDVIIYNDGSTKVMDIGELTEALESGIISVSQLKLALTRLDSLLGVIYGGGIDKLISCFNLE